VFRATEIFAPAMKAFPREPRRRLMSRLARHTRLLVFSHWTAPPPAQARRQVGPDWRPHGSSETPRAHLDSGGDSLSLRRAAGHQTPPDLAAAAYEPHRRSDLARAHRLSGLRG